MGWRAKSWVAASTAVGCKKLLMTNDNVWVAFHCFFYNRWRYDDQYSNYRQHYLLKSKSLDVPFSTFPFHIPSYVFLLNPDAHACRRTKDKS